MTDTPLLDVRHLKKYYRVKAGQLHAVDDVSFTIPRGWTLGVVGESGCGKSTLGRTLLQLEKATEGEVLYQGKDILNLKRGDITQLRREMSMIFQDPYASLNPRMNVRTLIADPLRANHACHSRNELNERVAELMETVGLAPRIASCYPHELDGGRRQRIGIAKALSLHPNFVVCDEPVSALDVSIQAQILNLLMDLRDEQGLTYMFITHNLGVVRHISDEIMVMYMGKCVERALSDELFAHPAHPYTKMLLSAIPIPRYDHIGYEPDGITGEITSPVNPKPGCRFAPRCPYCTDACRQGDISLKEISPNHSVACCCI